MKRELEDKLKADFPALFEDMHNPDLQGYSAMKFGCACEDGWYKIIRWASEQYKAWGEKHGIAIRFTQIKEKFGQLRMYWGFDMQPESSQWEELVEIDRQVSDKSDRACEFCGAESEQPYGRRASEGRYWIRTLCPTCREKDEKPKKEEAKA